MKKLLFNMFAITAGATLAVLTPGCSKSGTPGYEISIASDATHGNYLVDKDGHALYMFANDYNGRTSCTGSCLSLWPIFYAANLTPDKLGQGLSISDFDTIMVNGTPQLRYREWPLYYYAPASGYNGQNVREPAHQVTGDGVAGLWFVAKPDYSIMLADAQLVGNNGQDYKGDYTPGVGKTLFFTDGKGNSLYVFSRDSLNRNTFTKSDFSNNSIWPIYEDTLVVVPSVLDKSLFGKINVYGHKQLTYKGWPLYYFGADGLVRGNTKGVSVPVPGVWPVAVKDLPAPPSK